MKDSHDRSGDTVSMKNQQGRGKRDMSREALKLAEGVFAHSVDIVLWTCVYCAELAVPNLQKRNEWKAVQTADTFLDTINYDVIKNAIITAKKHGWVKSTCRGAMPEITSEGKRRLAAIIPRYDEKRVWDGRLHLVTYDIPEAKKHHRELLRMYLKRIGCGKLQDSVFLTPFNPIDTLQSFIKEHDLAGTVIISDLGKDASVGEETIKDLVARIYHLEDINNRYRKWLEERLKNKQISHQSLLNYLAILKDDPQIPFDLLPSDWKGIDAYSQTKETLRRLSF